MAHEPCCVLVGHVKKLPLKCSPTATATFSAVMFTLAATCLGTFERRVSEGPCVLSRTYYSYSSDTFKDPIPTLSIYIERAFLHCTEHKGRATDPASLDKDDELPR